MATCKPFWKLLVRSQPGPNSEFRGGKIHTISQEEDSERICKGVNEVSRWRFGELNVSNLSKHFSAQYSRYHSAELIPGIQPACWHKRKRVSWKDVLQGTLQSRGQDGRTRFWAFIPLRAAPLWLALYIEVLHEVLFEKNSAIKKPLTNFLFGCIQTNRKSSLSPCFLGPCISAFAHLFKSVPWVILKGLHKRELGVSDYMFFTIMSHQ